MTRCKPHGCRYPCGECATRCACAPACNNLAEQTEHSPYMDDFCHDCTMHRCDAVGGHVLVTGRPRQ